MDSNLFRELAALSTEGVLDASRELDTLSTLEVVRLMNGEDRRLASAVEACLPEIARVADAAAASFARGGRLVYVGAGTSGRLGVLDAAECPPTFGTDPAEVVGIIAGGRESMFRAQEGAEDDADAGRVAIDDARVSSADTVVGIAASRRTPWVRAALIRAREIGAFTALVTCNPGPVGDAADDPDVVVAPDTGPEVLSGSTRLKAGSAQKMCLNMISTAAMVRRGKTYGNLMVDLRPGSAKLVQRSRRIVMQVTGAEYKEAERLLAAAGGRVKIALVMALRGVDAAEAERRLAAAGGFVRRAIS
ncbi:MAG: N-acetylmuramic acid 6-phosphate etherase [bacterium]